MIKVEGERVEIRGNGVEMLNDWVMITSALYSDMSNDLGKEVANSLLVQALFEAVEIGSSIDICKIGSSIDICTRGDDI